MFGMSFWEIMFVLAIALIVIGPEKLPKVAKSLGRTFGEFKKATGDFKQSFDLGSDGAFDNVSKAFESGSKKTDTQSTGSGDSAPLSDGNVPLPKAEPEIAATTPTEPSSTDPVQKPAQEDTDTRKGKPDA